MAQQWDAFELLGIRNKDTGNVTCVGRAPSKDRRCQNAIADHNRASGMALLDKLPDLVGNKDFESTLASIAERLLCRHPHQNQVNKMVDQWKAAIKRCGKTYPVPIKLEHSSRVPFARAVSQSSDSSLDSIFSNGDISDTDSWREDDDEDAKSNIKVEGRGHSKKSATDLELRVKRAEELASTAAAQRDEALKAKSKARAAAIIAETEKKDAVKREAEEKEMWKKEALAARDEAERKAQIAAEDERREQQIEEERRAIQQEKEKLAAERKQFDKAKKDDEALQERLRQVQIEEELAEKRSRLEKEMAHLSKIRAETEAIKEKVIEAAKSDEERRKTRSQTAKAKAECDRVAAAEKTKTDALVARASMSAHWEFILPD